jgi:hypothetical protein
MNNNSTRIPLVLIIIGTLLIGYILGVTVKKTNSTNEDQYRYQLINANDSNLIFFDQKTGEYWRKFIPINEGPTEWEKEKSPIEK